MTDRCCHAVHDKVWVDAPEVPLRAWEFYTVLADDPRPAAASGTCCTTTSSTPGPGDGELLGGAGGADAGVVDQDVDVPTHSEITGRPPPMVRNDTVRAGVLVDAVTDLKRRLHSRSRVVPRVESEAEMPGRPAALTAIVPWRSLR
jgi:hypothetical protein